MKRSLALPALCAALLLLPSCIELDGADWVIDLASHRATLTFQNFRGTGESDLQEFINRFVKGDELTRDVPRAHVESREIVEEGERLDVKVVVTFKQPSEMALLSWDAGPSYRLCPNDEVVFTSANADFRDPDGCLIWNKDAQVLRLHIAQKKHSAQSSLLGLYKAWVAKGKPEPKS